MLITVAEIKSDWLSIAASDTSKDATIARYIAQAEKIIAGFCRQPIAEEYAKVIYFKGGGSEWYNTGYTVPVTVSSLYYRELPTDDWTAATGAVEFNGKIYLATGYDCLDWKLTANVGYRGGIASAVQLKAAGSGYTSSSSASTTVSDPSGATGSLCTLTTTASAGALTAVSIASGGREYNVSDTLAVAGGTSGTVQVSAITTNVPADIAHAAALLVVAAYKQSELRKGGGTIGVGSTSRSEGGVTTTITAKSVTADVQELLSPYKVWWF